MKEAECFSDEHGEDAHNKSDSLLYQQQQLELRICTAYEPILTKKTQTHSL